MFFNQYNPHPIRDCKVKTIGWIKNMIVVSTTTILQLQHMAQYIGVSNIAQGCLQGMTYAHMFTVQLPSSIHI
jgi:hypothetical protein